MMFTHAVNSSRRHSFKLVTLVLLFVLTYVYLFRKMSSTAALKEYRMLNRKRSTETTQSNHENLKGQSSFLTDSTGKSTNGEISMNMIEAFVPRTSEQERDMLRKLLNVFVQTVPSDITYFIYSGTLLGSYRHHGMIPWDDDIDVIVNVRHRSTLMRSLQSLKPEYNVTITNFSRYVWKLYHHSSTKVRLWKYPFLDIFFYAENEEFIWDLYPLYSVFKVEKKYVFPLTKRPFMGLMLPAPKNTEEFLKVYYDIDMCQTNIFDHKLEKDIPEKRVVQVPCEILRDRFQFVRRKHYFNQTIEMLEEGRSKHFNDIPAFFI